MEPCDRCVREVEVRYSCLGRRLCRECVSVVFTLTSGYQALRDVASSEVADIVRLATGTAPDDAWRCARCFASGLILPKSGNPMCAACLRALASVD